MGKWFALVSILCYSSSLFAQTIQLDEFSTGYSSPLDIENCGDSRLFIVQKDGYIYICDSAGNKNSTPFLDIHTKVKTVSERGLLGLAFPPDYFNSGYFFIYYSQLNSDSNVIARYKVDPLNPDLADPNSEQIIFKISHPNYDNHDGGCLRFGKDGYLYAGTGDGGSAWDPDNNAQNRKKYLGKLLRLDVNVDSGYVVPPDNPFINDATFYPEVWALGLRNPWRYSYDRLTHDLWIADVGQGTWEEIDLIAATDTGGQNYGWDCYEGLAANETGHCDSAGDLTWPIYVYQHQGGDCSITGGFVYRGALFKNFYGKYIFTDYCSGKFRLMESDGNGGWIVTQANNSSDYNYVSFGEDRYGELYVAGISDGKIYHITDSACAPVAQILVQTVNNDLIIDSVACETSTLQTPYSPSLQYQWQLNGADIPGATENSISAADTGMYTVIVTKSSGCTSTSKSVHVGSLSSVSISGIDSLYCIFQGPDTLVGVPAGGVFSGDGVVGNIFYPEEAGAGQHTIQYTFINEYHCEQSTGAMVTVDLCTGLNELWNENGINIFPNPADGDLNILFRDAVETDLELSVINMAGQKYLNRKYSLLDVKNNLLNVDLSSVPNGIYTLKMVSGNKISLLKIVIQH